ncbi:MAG: condensation domain-containing protein [Chthoniobacterales bacterium]
METDVRTRLQEMVASGQVRLQPLTFPQRELWETSFVPPTDPSHTIGSFLDIRGPLSFAMCRDALRLVIERQEVMRTSFLPGKDRPVQMIRAHAEPVLTYRELASGEADDANILEVLHESFRRPFDLVRGPLYRLEMLRRGPDHHALGLGIHHAIADGWTVTSFVEDFCTACVIVWRKAGKDMSRLRGIRDSLPPLALTYSAWGAAERVRWQPARLEPHAAYWQDRLSGTKLLFDAPAETALAPMEKWTTSLPAELAEPLRALAKRSETTLFSVLATAFRLALFRWKGADDVVLGTPVAGRAKAASKEVMGYFSGIVPLRARLDPALSFEQMLEEVHRQAVDDFAHAMPFVELAAAVERGAPRRRHAIFDVRFAVQNHPWPSIKIPGISTKLRTLTSGTSRFDIACELTEDGRMLELIWLHRPTVMTALEVRDLDRIFREVLVEAGTRPAPTTN